MRRIFIMFSAIAAGLFLMAACSSDSDRTVNDITGTWTGANASTGYTIIATFSADEDASGRNTNIKLYTPLKELYADMDGYYDYYAGMGSATYYNSNPGENLWQITDVAAVVSHYKEHQLSFSIAGMGSFLLTLVEE